MKNGSAKRDEVIKILEEMKIEINGPARKKLDNYRYSDETKITVGKNAIEVRTDFPDGQSQLMDIDLFGSGVSVHGIPK